ncbi:MAG: hypothetical protein ACAI44_03660 [Candidatus Sericytochromatia bacterium]
MTDSDFLPSLSQVEGAQIVENHLKALVQLGKEQAQTPEDREKMEKLTRNYIKLSSKLRQVNRRIAELRPKG